MNKYIVRTFSKSKEFFTIISAESMYDAEDKVMDLLERSVDLDYLDMGRQKVINFNFSVCLN